MFIGRKEELKKLENAYLSEHNNLLMIYGREGVGKTALVLNFCENRRFFYYNAIETTPAMQLEMFRKVAENVDGTHVTDKKILVIDSFRYFLCDETKKYISELMQKQGNRIMIILISSSVNWVENSMVSEAKEISGMLTGIIKLKELSFRETVEWFPKLSVDDCVIIRSVFGGIPRYLRLWQDNRKPRENIVSLVLSKDSPLAGEAEATLKLELRELAAYNAILLALASGKYKLNDIFSATGFSRAKISVYIKNLIAMDVVEKIVPANVRKYENTQKGLYRIKDSYLRFYYAYVLPNSALIEQGKGRTVYDDVILRDNSRFMRETFADVAKEFLLIMSGKNRLKAKYGDFRVWIGKTGTLDVVAGAGDGSFLAAICFYDSEETDIEHLKLFEELITKAGLRCREKFIFSRSGFTDRTLKLAELNDISVVSMADL